jgi:hypothetical protein
MEEKSFGKMFPDQGSIDLDNRYKTHDRDAIGP